MFVFVVILSPLRWVRVLHVQVSNPGVGGGKDTNRGLMVAWKDKEEKKKKKQVGDHFFVMQIKRKKQIKLKGTNILSEVWGHR